MSAAENAARPAAMADDEAAAYIGVRPGWLRTNRNASWAPPYMRYGARTIRYRRVDLDAWMDACRENNNVSFNVCPECLNRNARGSA